MSRKNIIPVTQPYLPPLDEFFPYLQQIWANRWVTNNGPFHEQFEEALKGYLGVEHISVFTNGTLALITALQALRITGEVITTPFSFVATTHALQWNGIKPVFVDIDPGDFNLNADLIEAAITPSTTAILPVHVYGKPCNLEAIQNIADAYGLKLIYDAAHAFGIKKKGVAVANFGDLSVLSFHGTKVFNTFEGGAIVSHDAKTKKRIDNLKNFGFLDEVTVIAPGINAKMNEFQAALGLLQLEHIDGVLSERCEIDKRYRKDLSGIPGIEIPAIPGDIVYNYSYFPILIEKKTFGMGRDELYDTFRKSNIHSRRYFYPLISNMPTYRGLKSSSLENLPIANEVAKKILCLPIYPALSKVDQDEITGILVDSLRSAI